MKVFATTLDLDPVRMGIRNRVTDGSSLRGDIQYLGGVLVEGRIDGEPLIINGHAVVLATGVVRGRVVVMGNLYLLGTAGDESMPIDMEVHGLVYAGESSRALGQLACASKQFFAGAQLVLKMRRL